MDSSVFKRWESDWEGVMKMKNEVHKEENHEMRKWSVLIHLFPPRGRRRF